MATNTGSSGTDDLFQRKATGLLRGWSVWDGFIYAAFSINLITLGLLGLSYAPFVPDGSLIMAVILAGLYLIFQTVTYASLIAVMPRAGGDYVWTSRVLGGGIGFVLAVTGWWFILWHWVPIYADLLNKEVFVPLAAIANLDGTVAFFGSATGLFVSSMVVAVLASVYVSLGMRAYARIQKFCFYGGLVGLAVMVVLLLVNSNADFVSAYNREAQVLFGAGGNAYQQTVQAGEAAGGLQTGSALGPNAAPDPLPRVLEPVLELGRHALRRGARGLGLPQEHLRDGGRSPVHLVSGRGPAPALRQDVRLGLLLRGERGLLGRRRSRSRRGLTRGCSPPCSSRAPSCSSSSWP